MTPLPDMKSRLLGGAKLALLAGAAAIAVPAQADTLREALVEAYQTNPTLQAARANQRANDEQDEDGQGTWNAHAHVGWILPLRSRITVPRWC